MPKKGAGGKRHQKGKKYDNDPIVVDAPIKEEEEQEYAQVQRMLGNGRVQATLLNPKHPSRLCIIPGKFRKRKVWINPGDLILVNIRSFQEDKCDIVYKYTDPEIRQLKKNGEIDKNFQISSDVTANTQDDNNEDDVFDFADSDESVDLEDL